MRLALAAIAALCVAPALARGTHDGGNAAWFSAQYNHNGEWCCDVSDGHEFDGNYVVNANGSVTIETDDGDRTLPAYMVLSGPNPTGHAVWWFTESPIVGHHDYCFAPGAAG
jgi:hypothetical protein